MTSQDTMFDTPVIAGTTGDTYRSALRTLVAACQEFLAHEDADAADEQAMCKLASRMARHLREDGYRPRERMTSADALRGSLLRLTQAVDEYVDLRDHEDGVLGLRVWEAFEGCVKVAARSADSTLEWAPEDDTNPIKVVPVPQPDPGAEPINGVRQGDMVKADWMDEPRQVLTGPDDRGFVRLSDPRDGAGNFGGYFVQAESLGKTYVPVVTPLPTKRGDAS